MGKDAITAMQLSHFGPGVVCLLPCDLSSKQLSTVYTESSMTEEQFLESRNDAIHSSRFTLSTYSQYVILLTPDPDKYQGVLRSDKLSFVLINILAIARSLGI